MIKQKEILDSVEQLLLGRFPDMKAYRNMVRQGFQRPSFLVAGGKQTMADATARTVERTAQVKITFFVPVDDYHDSQVDELSDLLVGGMELFSCRAIAVKDRYLDVGDVSGEAGYDFAELTVPLSWQDDRDITPVAAEPLENYDISVRPDGREEE